MSYTLPASHSVRPPKQTQPHNCISHVTICTLYVRNSYAIAFLDLRSQQHCIDPPDRIHRKFHTLSPHSSALELPAISQAYCISQPTNASCFRAIPRRPIGNDVVSIPQHHMFGLPDSTRVSLLLTAHPLIAEIQSLLIQLPKH